MKFIVFGLGNYGSSLATKLASLGHEVIGVDNKIDIVERFKETITHTIALDAVNREAMMSLPLKDVDAAIVTIGETPGTTIMTTALLKQLGCVRIICRVISPLQQTVLESMNIKEFVYPEADAAERMAYKLDLKGTIDSYKISNNYQLLEVEVPQRYVGTKVSDVNFVGEHQVQLITVIRPEDEKNIFGAVHPVRKVMGIISSDIELEKGDSIILFGEVKKLENFIEF